MKKIMLSSVILLPLIILLILTIGTVVVGVTNHIYVETVAFREVDTLVLVKDSLSAVPSAKPEVNVFPLTASNAEIVFTSDNEDIVKIDADGTVHGVDFGETRIRAASKENPAISSERVVLVTDTRVHRAEIENAPSCIYEGQRIRLVANVFPKEAEDKSVLWSSSDPSVLEVSSDGTLNFRSVGRVSVTASCVSDPSVSASVEIECKRPVSSIDTGGIMSVTTAAGKAQFPAVRFTPADAKEAITYTVSDESIASVSETGEITFKKAGKTDVVATVSDGLGNVASAKVSYEYTDGKYQNIWFERGGVKVDAFSVDYDAYAGGKDIGLSVCGTPADAVSGIEITYSAADKIECGEDGKFFAVGTGEVVVNASVQTYTGKTVSASCTVRITRKIGSIAFPGAEEDSVSVTLPSFDVWTVAEVQPSGGNDAYTEDIRFASSDPSIATVDKDGRVQFKKEGTVYITVRSESGVERHLKITYVNVPIGEKEIKISDATSSGSLFGLAMNSLEVQSGTLVVAPPAGYDGELCYEIVEGDSVQLNKNRVTAKHGGFTTVRVSAAASSAFRARGMGVWSRDIVLYVDETIQDMDFNYPTGYRFSGSGIGLKLLVSNAGALEGKIVRYRLKSASSAASVDPVTGELKFNGAGSATVVAEIFYDEEKLAGTEYDFTAVLDKKEITVTSLYGNLDEFIVCHNGSEVEQDEPFAINVGDSLIFIVDKDRFSPSDFVLTEDKVSFYSDSDALQCKFDAETGEITLKGVAGTFTGQDKAGPVYAEITVGGKTLRIRITVNSYADRISVQSDISSSESPVRNIVSDKAYVTLTDGISLRISLSREDGLVLTDRTLGWTCGERSGSLDLGETDVLELTNLPLGNSEVRLQTAGGTDFLFVLERRDSLEDFGIAFRYTKNNGVQGQYTAAQIESAAAAQSTFEIGVPFPEEVKKFFAYVTLPQNYLGTLNEAQFRNAFTFSVPSGGFALSYDAEIAMVEFSITSEKAAFKESVQLTHGDLQLGFLISRSDLKSISFGDSSVSFDMHDRAMDGAVYRGLQQVRLFAKHSYYNGAAVDYYKLPLALEGSIEAVQWTFTPYAGNAAGEARTVQIGNTINSGGKQYIVGQDDIPASVSWVDIRPYAQEKCVYVYFGDFDGLSEKDIQTDNFGNFDGREGYTAVNASDPGAFLQLSASDGTENGVSAYYNFNVLNDVQGKVVNIFDANGFYNNSAFVLHANLYSPTDKPADAPETVVLSDGSKNYGKSFIFGNGYQINFKSKNDSSNSQKVDIGVGRSYNAVLKGNDVVTRQNEPQGYERRAVFGGSYFRYCKILACEKGIWTGNGSEYHIENCVFQYMDDMAIQLSNAVSKVYLKNIVLIDSNKGLENQKEAFYVDGFIDCFNYKAEENLSGLGIPSSAADKILDEAENYVEILNGKPFFNLVMAFSKSGASTRPLYLWDGSAVDNETGWAMADHVRLKRVHGSEGFLGLGAVGVWTYVYAEDMPANAYRISLQCQGKEWDGDKECLVENTDHLAWHMNRCYRDHSLAGWDIEDHAEHLARSLA